jgi:structural maintenance of chromosome 1
VHNIKTQNKALSGLREEQRVHDEALKEARVEQAKARTNVMQKEKKIKKMEKTLENKVFPSTIVVDIC